MKMSSLVSGLHFFDRLSEDRNYVDKGCLECYLKQILLDLFLNTLVHE